MSREAVPAPHRDSFDDALLPVALAIGDGVDVDWGRIAELSPAANMPLDPLIGLQKLEQLVRGHEILRDNSPGQPDSTPYETLLTEARQSARLSPDDVLRVRWGPLEVLEKVGRGAFGDVYRAWDPRLRREVALKLVPERLSADVASPVIEEGLLLARIKHPNVLTVHGAERIDGRIGIWTEFVGGETLAAEVARRGPLPVPEAARIGLDLARALAAVHEAGVLHRDVKAENIMRDPQGRVVLGDFGVGATIADVQSASAPQPAGTPLYLAPEVIVNGQASPASDLYGLGVTLYYLVTGKYPINGRTLAEVRRAHSIGQRARLTEVSSALPDPFAAIVEALLDPVPRQRPASAASVEAALQRWLEEERPTPAPAMTDAVGLRRRLAQRTTVGVLGVAVVTAALVWVIKAQHPGVLPFEARDWILIAPFENRTGEPIVDGTIEFAFERELAHSAFVNVVPRERVEDVLQLMSRPLDTRLDAQIGREVCLRDGGIRALLTGLVEKPGSAYLVTVQIVRPSDGMPVATLTEDVASQSELLPAVRKQAFQLRRALGEALASIEASRQELAQVTTPSFEALSLYSRAASAMQVSPRRNDAAEQFLKEALNADPDFPSALVLMAWAINNQRRPRDEYLPYAERAFQLAEKVSLPERYFITASLHQLRAIGRASSPEGLRENERAAPIYEALLGIQPDHPWAANNLRNVYRPLGRRTEADQLLVRLANDRPWNFEYNSGAAAVLLRQSRVSEARPYQARAIAVLSPELARRFPLPSAETRLFDADAAWLENDPRKALEIVDATAESTVPLQPEEFDHFTRHRARLYLTLGRLDQAETTARTLADASSRHHEVALVLAERADVTRLRNHLAGTYREPAQAGRVAFFVRVDALVEAERELEWVKGQAKINTLPDLFEGLVHHARGRPEQAIAPLDRSRQQNRARSSELALLASLTLARVWDTLGDVPQAIRVLLPAVDRPSETTGSWSSGFRWIECKAELARLYRKAGRDHEAREIESDLRALLAVADADHRVLSDLRARTREP